MKIGLAGYQGSGKSTVFELLTGLKPDASKAHAGQLGVATIPDERFDRLVQLLQPKKATAAKIELFDTPGLSRQQQDTNAQRLAVIREAAALVHVIGSFAGCDALSDARMFEDGLVWADLQVVSNRIARLKIDVTKPRPDRDELQAELEALEPIEAILHQGRTLQGVEMSEQQDKLLRSFALLSQKQRLIVLNTAESTFDGSVVSALQEQGQHVIAAPFGLELEVMALTDEERSEFAAEMGLDESSRGRLLTAIFQVTDQITFYTCNDKEVHAWLLKRGSTAMEAAGSIHSDLARGFIRVQVISTQDLLRLGSEREVKAAGLHHVEGKDYVVQDGDEMLVRFNV